MVKPGNSKKVQTASAKQRSNSIATWDQPGDLVCLLGPKWSSYDLVKFYLAYRKSGKDWAMLAAAIGHGRTKEMVESLYKMNKAYLSLPDGLATLGGFVSIMKDRYENIMEDGLGEEQAMPVDFDAKDGSIKTMTGSELKGSQLVVESPPLCKTYSRKPKRMKIKFGGKLYATPEAHADDLDRETGTEVSCELMKHLDKDQEILRKRLFGDDERITTACEALLMLSTQEPLYTDETDDETICEACKTLTMMSTNEPLNRDETGLSSELLKDGTSAMDVDDKSKVPEAANRPSLGGEANNIFTAEGLPHPTEEPAEHCPEANAGSAQMMDTNAESLTSSSDECMSEKQILAGIMASLEGVKDNFDTPRMRLS